MKNKLLLLTAVLLFFALFAGCAKTPVVPPPDIDDTPSSAGGSLTGLLSVDKVSLSNELMTAFFEYYSEQPLELRFLPQFDAQTKPDWDELSHFLFSHADVSEDSKGQYFTKKESFRTVKDLYFNSLDYTDKSSVFVNYVEDNYIATGWDTNGRLYYRLTSISKDKDGVFSASFDGVLISESDFSSEYALASPNMKALMDAAKTKLSVDDINKWMLELLSKDNYHDTFEISEAVEISFVLSGVLSDSEGVPFKYLACERNLLY